VLNDCRCGLAWMDGGERAIKGKLNGFLNDGLTPSAATDQGD